MPEVINRFRTDDKRVFWEAHLERWAQSGLSQRSYCREHTLKPHQFYYWRRCILKPQPEISFLPVRLLQEHSQHPQTVRLLMPNGYTIELEGWNEPAKIERLLAMVAAL